MEGVTKMDNPNSHLQKTTKANDCNQLESENSSAAALHEEDPARASTDIRYPDRDHDHERNQDPDRDDEYSERNEDFIRDYDFDFDYDYDYDYDHYYVEDFGNIDEEEDPSHLQTSPRVINPLDYPDDESYSRALQIALDENLARNMMSLSIAQRTFFQRNSHDIHDYRQHHFHDIDHYSYEEIIALSESFGSVSKGLPFHKIKSLPTVIYNKTDAGNVDICTICQYELEDTNLLIVLPCKHKFHSECISKWLEVSKDCPECKQTLVI